MNMNVAICGKREDHDAAPGKNIVGEDDLALCECDDLWIACPVGHVFPPASHDDVS